MLPGSALPADRTLSGSLASASPSASSCLPGASRSRSLVPSEALAQRQLASSRRGSALFPAA